MRCIEDNMDIAEAAGSPHSDPQISSKAFNAILKVDVFNNSMREWRCRPQNDKK